MKKKTVAGTKKKKSGKRSALAPGTFGAWLKAELESDADEHWTRRNEHMLKRVLGRKRLARPFDEKSPWKDDEDMLAYLQRALEEVSGYLTMNASLFAALSTVRRMMLEGTWLEDPTTKERPTDKEPPPRRS